MGKRNKHIDDLVEQTLKAFEGIERAKPKPFLYTRIKGRMEKQGVPKSTFGILSPAFQKVMLAIVILVLAVNIFTTASLLVNPEAAESIQPDEQAFGEEFYPSTPTLYSIDQTSNNP